MRQENYDNTKALLPNQLRKRNASVAAKQIAADLFERLTKGHVWEKVRVGS